MSDSADMSGRCASSQLFVADPWDFERAFTTVDPRVRYRQWNRELQRSMLAYKAAPGMTPLMLAFAFGFPSTFGTARALMQRQYWRWYPGSSIDTSAIFYDGSLLRSTSDVFFFSSEII